MILNPSLKGEKIVLNNLAATKLVETYKDWTKNAQIL